MLVKVFGWNVRKKESFKYKTNVLLLEKKVL